MRSIRSYVLRQGRVSNAQQHAYDTLLPVYGIPYQSTQIDLNAIFGRSAPKIIEIGFGMGEATTQIALAEPGYDFLGIEVHTPGVGGLLKKIEENALTNVRIIQHDAVEVLTNMIMPASLSGIHIFFPDPWPKKRHHKRRLIQSSFIALTSARLKKGGYIHMATDWQAYAEEMLKVLSNEPSLQNTATGYAPRPLYRPLTKFEQRGMNLGHQVWDLVFKKL